MDERIKHSIDSPQSQSYLPMNIQGIIQLIESARDNLESANYTIDLVEEFFRTLGAISYSRIKGQTIPLDTENRITEFIQEKMSSPSFGTWLEFSDLCIRLLQKVRDRYADDFTSIMENQIRNRDVAKEILRKIYNLKSEKSPHKNRIKVRVFLNEIVNLRNIIRHRTLSNSSLQSLIDIGISDYVIDLVTTMFEKFRFRLFFPMSIEEKGVMSYIVEGAKRKYIAILSENREKISFGECYLQIYHEEDPFRYRTRIIEYDWKDNHFYVYLSSEGVQVHCIPLQGSPHSRRGKWNSLEEVFEISDSQGHIVHDVVINLEYLLDVIKQQMGLCVAMNLEQMECDSTVKLVVANSLLKEHNRRTNLEWDWKKWYAGLIIGFIKLEGV
ncbi:MAG: hypothetical protein JW779_12025 [Candidatus Thorarchaeota archaeon]|nr:hypothetical protein [Candidatus Thorarchaeota archaeon]